MDKLNIDQSKLFIIIGIGRSGTSLLQAVMNTFEGFCNNKESRFGPERLSCYSYVIKFNDFSYLENFIKKNWTDKYFVEKTPNSILCLPQLYDRFPHANYLFLERNPLKIILSQMNFFPPGERYEKEKEIWLKQGNISKEDLKLNFEQLMAKQILKRVKIQIENKSKFHNSISLKYENLVKDLEYHLELMKKTFNISPNIDMAKQVFLVPSNSSKNNIYNFISLTDNDAISMIKESCKLWGYDYNI
jgi:hypothetical protein